MPDVFWRQLIAPFIAVPVFFVAYYIARWITPWLPAGRIKQFLTKPRSNRSAFFERQDARLFLFLRSLWRATGAKKATKRGRYLSRDI